MEDWVIEKERLYRSQLPFEQYFVLYLLFHKEIGDLDRMFPFEGEQDVLLHLQANNYVRIEGHCWKSIVITFKVKELFSDTVDMKPEKVVGFETFWKMYHAITKKPKVDKSPAEKYWKKLSPQEKQKAVNSKVLEDYCNNVDFKYRKKARTYLADKNFDDEWTVSKKKVNRM